MAERTKRQNEIVGKMIEDALVAAAEFERECETFAALQPIDEMVDLIAELRGWIDDRNSVRLDRFGISMQQGINGHLLFGIAERVDPFIVRPRADMTIAAGNTIIQVDPELPVLDEKVYAEVMEGLLVWAGVSNAGQRKQF